MLWSNIAILIKVSQVTNDVGDNIANETKRIVFVNRKSIRQSEYYQALSTGLKPEVMLEVRNIDYEDEKLLEFNDRRYKVIRTFDKNGEITELICGAII